MRNRWFFEIVTIGLLMAAGSVMGPVKPASTAWGGVTKLWHNAYSRGVRG